MPSDQDPTVRFDGREDDYDRFRPGYPSDVVRLLQSKGLLFPGAKVADIGSGTGILTAMLVEAGAFVYGVEPNACMRGRAEARFRGVTSFESVPKRAEATGLPDQSVDLITAAQSFHWFDLVGSRLEFQRILRPGGAIVLIWNNRLDDQGIFNIAYSRMLKDQGVDDSRGGSDEEQNNKITSFFEGKYEYHEFGNDQSLDLVSLKGRLRSSSYCPRPESPSFGKLMEAVDSIFAEHQKNGAVLLRYRTDVYLGSLP
ncbi:MAG: class I SAM-dependent methyltransferase [Methanomassiliicoccales archaeon]